MFSEILKIIPKLDNSELNKMEQTLGQRFAKIAKRFGGGILGALKGAGVAGMVLTLIEKVLNPLQEVQQAIERTLKSSDDIVTNANQFNTTTGKLYKLITLAKASGLDQDSLFVLLNKYQGAIAQAKADPNAPGAGAVKNYLNDKDIADSFYSFIQQLQKMDRNQQILVQQAVFGEKQILKMSDFLNTNFAETARVTGLNKVGSEKLTKDLEKLGALNDYKDALKARLELNDIATKSQIITKGMIEKQAEGERINLERENARIQSYQDLATISQSVDKIMALVEEGVAMLGKLIAWVTPTVNKIIEYLDKIVNSRFIKGLMGGK